MATSLGMPEPPETGKGRKDSPLGPLERTQPWDTVILDFWPQNHESESVFAVLAAPGNNLKHEECLGLLLGARPCWALSGSLGPARHIVWVTPIPTGH